MTSHEVARAARSAAVHGHSVVMSVLNDDEFMRDVADALDEEARGYKGKTIEEIRRDHGLKD